MQCCTFSDTVSQALLWRASCVTTSGLMWFFCGCNCSSSQSEHYASQTALMITDPSSDTYTLWHIRKSALVPMRKKTTEGDDSRNDIPIWEISSRFEGRQEPLASAGFVLGPSLNDLSRCFSRNAGVRVVLSCAPTLLCTNVSHSHFVTFPLFLLRTGGAEWVMKPALSPESLPSGDTVVHGKWWQAAMKQSFDSVVQDGRETAIHKSARSQVSLLCC